jgi:hypothetical protein
MKHVTPVRVWKMLLGCDQLTDAEFERWIDEMHESFRRERLEREGRCIECGASLAHIVGPGEPGKRVQATICPVCHPELIEDICPEEER